MRGQKAKDLLKGDRFEMTAERSYTNTDFYNAHIQIYPPIIPLLSMQIECVCLNVCVTHLLVFASLSAPNGGGVSGTQKNRQTSEFRFPFESL